MAVNLTADDEVQIAVGASLPALEIGGKTYADVHITAVNDVSLIFTHRGGLASVRLRDLPPELQARLGYDPDKEREAIDATRSRPEQPKRIPARTASAGAPARPAISPDGDVEETLRRFGTSAPLLREVNLKPRFRELELPVKDQGYSPNCAVYAVVCALEFQNARVTGMPEKFSESYLAWATRKINSPADAPEAAPVDPRRLHDPDYAMELAAREKGFRLPDVVTALRSYGIPPSRSTQGKLFGKEPPDDALIDEARHYRRVFIHQVPGNDNGTMLANIIHALNAGIPVPVALRWPHDRAIRNGVLDDQHPGEGYLHAVTLVGYRCAGSIDGTFFYFRNSYGAGWGQAGYGQASFNYLKENMLYAVLLEVVADPPRGPSSDGRPR